MFPYDLTDVNIFLTLFNTTLTVQGCRKAENTPYEPALGNASEGNTAHYGNTNRRCLRTHRRLFF